MFSYRHAFHAGNHADALKHLTLIGALRHLMRKPGPVTLIDTHAGAGRYRLDGDMAAASGEARAGVLRLLAALPGQPDATRDQANDLLAEYRALLAAFNPQGAALVYPGSPLVLHHYMTRPERLDGAISRDRLHLYELHPTDSRALLALAASLPSRRRVHAERADGFAALRALLPPPADGGGSRRALALIDPSYEIKSDYAKVEQAVQDALQRFATGVYLVWYPIIGRAQAHQLPRRLQALARQAGRDWLHARLNIGQSNAHPNEAGPTLRASGMFVINPPYPLADALRAALPDVLTALAQGPGRDWQVETGASAAPAVR
ncbi:MAG: 23S rRNA (adenine(2030)-N(6))-methyltransferase RlmJ [Burkholderiaceae bacterium]|jgi:23S rRNA (adenine2030-N6)-methyltransferase|nr:23S rRNA (adenine(2030)-N(6))-methyltransferase RlmJ [Burkholderiaceae bacterium]